MIRPKLFSKVSASRVAVKSRRSAFTSWHGIEVAPFEGYYVGRRLVYDGKTKYHVFGDNEVETEFTRTATHEVWLLLVSEFKNPIRVFPKDVVTEISDGNRTDMLYLR